ncbi:branched-chain amino acid ABC transporter permease [Altererythrobacter xixiisoli]|uniref:Branched-chain amino acid ABC transporter permease n=1 Tax=Croceibacterium xixiisoli TaxID=1476466 RepID=A0A6I4TRP3_9SPHN|nr:AzlC family ABC transporter permease [Croceibacterium xixiisoli]MXO97811.1 branched-chain amino acid ABC transporter permease [Croceibacterium xixiisoli]
MTALSPLSPPAEPCPVQNALPNRARNAEIRRGIKASLPVMIGFVPFALVLGAQARTKGFAFAEVPLMTGLNFGGGSEFAAVGLWTSPPHLLLILAVTLLVNSRHILMGATLAPFLRHLPRRKVLPMLFLMCDESWAMALTDAKARQREGRAVVFSLPYYLSLSIGLYLSWVVFTALGAMIGPVLGDVTRFGFDMAFPAVFFVLLRGMWKGAATALPWAACALVAGTVYATIPGAWYVPAGALTGVITAWLIAGRRV